MKMAKKFALVVVASAFVAGALGGCGGEEKKTEPAKPADTKPADTKPADAPK